MPRVGSVFAFLILRTISSFVSKKDIKRHFEIKKEDIYVIKGRHLCHKNDIYVEDIPVINIDAWGDLSDLLILLDASCKLFIRVP